MNHAESFFIYEDNRYTRILISRIRFIKKFKKYVRIITPGCVHSAMLSIKEIEEYLPATEFCRVHRSFIVAISCVTAFNDEYVFLDDIEIPLSEDYRKLFIDKVTILGAERVSA